MKTKRKSAEEPTKDIHEKRLKTPSKLDQIWDELDKSNWKYEVRDSEDGFTQNHKIDSLALLAAQPVRMAVKLLFQIFQSQTNLVMQRTLYVQLKTMKVSVIYLKLIYVSKGMELIVFLLWRCMKNSLNVPKIGNMSTKNLVSKPFKKAYMKNKNLS